MELIKKKTKEEKVIVIIVIVFLIGAVIGYATGFKNGASYVIKEGLYIMEHFVEIDINEKLIEDAIFNYNNQIKSCFVRNLTNALNSSSTGN